MGDRRKPGRLNPGEVDPSVYYYDEVYDEDKKDNLDKELGARKNARIENIGCKYITKIKEEAELRKTEKEIRKFKKYTRDRLDVDSNEEIFVTSSYKKRLAEIKQIEKSLNRVASDERTNDKTSRNQDNDKPQTSNIDQQSGSKSPSSIQPTKPLKRQPKTYAEKKEFLRKVLAKRTVGKVYLDAVERYKQRKVASKA